MKRASSDRGRPATVRSQLIDGILAAATAAGLVDSARVEPLRAGVSARSVGIQQSGRVSETALLWLWGALADLAGGHRVGAELAPFAGASAWGVVAEAAVHAVSLTDAFERVARYVRLAVEGVRIGIDVNDRSFTVTYRLLGSGANPSSGGAAAAMLWANANLALLPERAFGVRLRPVSAELACVAPDDTGRRHRRYFRDRREVWNCGLAPCFRPRGRARRLAAHRIFRARIHRRIRRKGTQRRTGNRRHCRTGRHRDSRPPSRRAADRG